MKHILTLVLACTLPACPTLTSSDYTRIGEIVNEAIVKARPSGK